MIPKMITASILAVILSVFAVGGLTRSSGQNSRDQSTQDQSKPEMMGQGMMGGGMMGQMTTHHQEMSTLMNKLMQSMTAIQNEKDPTALKSKLAEHNTLLKEMHDQMMQQGTMMQNVSGEMMKSCPTGNDAKPPTK